MTTFPLQNLVAKLNAARLRCETLHGREYLVVPTTIMRPDSVMNGSKGPLFYPRSEVARNPGIWNAVPLLLNHPPEGTTGRDPEIIARYGLGYVFRDRVTKNGSRVAEAWFDVERVQHHDKSLPTDKKMLPRLNAGQSVDVSTGLYTDDKAHSTYSKNALKDYRGRDYKGDVATNYRPDHLAVLPTAKGACPVPDCGTGVVNTSHEELKSKLHSAIRSGMTQDQPQPFIHEVHPDYVIYEHGSDLKKQKYKADADGDNPTLVGKPKPVERKITYEPSETTNEEGDDMPLTPKQRASKVKGLVANCECWSGKDKVLNAMDDETLTAVHSQAVQVENQTEALDAVRETLGLNEDADAELVFNAEYVKSPDFKKKMKAACNDGEDDAPVGPKKNKARRQPVTNDEDDAVENDALAKAIEEQVGKAVAAHPVVNNAERVVARERADLRAKLTVVANLKGTPAAKKTLIMNKLKDKELGNDALEELLTLVGEPTRNARQVSDDDGDGLPDYSGAASYGEFVTSNEGDDATTEVRAKFADDGGLTPTVNWDNRLKEVFNGQRKGAA